MRSPKFPVYYQNRASGQARSVKHSLFILAVCKDGLSLQKEDHLKWQVQISAFSSGKGFDSSRAALGLSPIPSSRVRWGPLTQGCCKEEGEQGWVGNQLFQLSSCLSQPVCEQRVCYSFFLPASFQSLHRSKISFRLPKGKLQISLPLTEPCFQEKPGAALKHVQAQKCSGCVYFLCSGQSQSCCRC